MACLKQTKAAKPLKKPQAYSILYVQGKHVFKIDLLLLFIKVSGTFFTFWHRHERKKRKMRPIGNYFLLTFAMCLAHLTCVNGPTIQLVLRELLLWINVLDFWIKILKKYFICHCSLFYNSSKNDLENTNSEIREIFRNSSDGLLAFLELNHTGLSGTKFSWSAWFLF